MLLLMILRFSSNKHKGVNVFSLGYTVHSDEQIQLSATNNVSVHADVMNSNVFFS